MQVASVCDPPALPCLHDADLIMLSRCLIVVEGREPCATLLHVLEDGSDLRHLVLLARGKGPAVSLQAIRGHGGLHDVGSRARACLLERN